MPFWKTNRNRVADINVDSPDTPGSLAGMAGVEPSPPSMVESVPSLTPRQAYRNIMNENAKLQDTTYLDRADENSEWQSQMDAFADAYDDDDDEDKLVPVHRTITLKDPSRRPSYIITEQMQEKGMLLRSLFGDTNFKSPKKHAPRRSISWNPFITVKDKGAFVIHPLGTFRQTWDIVSALAIAYTFFVLPVRFAFFWNAKAEWDWYQIIDLLIDLFFIIDVCLNFFTGYLDIEQDTIIMKRPLIARQYIRTTFLPDILASLPYALLDNFFLFNVVGVLRFWRLLRLLRFLRIQRMVKFSKKRTIMDRFSTFAKRILKLLMVVMIFSHWNACAQYFVVDQMDYPDDSWVIMDGIYDDSVFDKYSWALFRSFSHMLCIGYGRGVPSNVPEVWLVQVSMITGASLYALLVGIIATLLIQVDSSASIYNQRIDTIKQYAHHRKLPRELTSRILNSVNYRWKKYKAFDETDILEGLPNSLRTEVCLYASKDLIRSMPFLHQAEEGLILTMVTLLQPQSFIKGELIIRQGETAKEMYFLNEGIVQVENEGTVITNLRKGSYFGEIGLLRESKRVASVRAKTNVDAYALSKVNFESIMREYPDSAVAMAKIAEHRQYNLDEISKSKRASIKLKTRPKHKSFLESVEELENISKQSGAYKKSRTVSMMRDLVNRRESIYGGGNPTSTASPRTTSEGDGYDTDPGSADKAKPKLDTIHSGHISEGMQSNLSKKEMALISKEYELIAREKAVEAREKNVSQFDDFLPDYFRPDETIDEEEAVAKPMPFDVDGAPVGVEDVNAIGVKPIEDVIAPQQPHPKLGEKKTTQEKEGEAKK